MPYFIIFQLGIEKYVIAEAYSEPCQTSKKGLWKELFKGLKGFTI